MKVAIGSAVIAAAVLIAGAAPASAATQSTTANKPSDSSLDERIEKRIHDSSLRKYDIDVTVDDGVAKLSGTVAREADRRKAAQLATIPGIARVDNQLKVDLNAKNTAAAAKDKAKGTAGTVERKVDKGADKTKEGVDKAIDKSAEGIGVAAEKTEKGVVTGYEKSKEGVAKAADKSAEGVAKAGEGIAKVGEVITDTFLKTRVKAKFVDEDVLKDSDISVDVTDHVVTLSGTVTSEAGRARAVEEAKKVDGVHSVVDKLTIGPKK